MTLPSATTDARQVTADNGSNRDAPAKASAAPLPASNNVFQGLCQQLNKWQKSLVPKVYDIADVYEIVFVPTSLSSATLKKQGNTDDGTVPMQQPTTAKGKVDPQTNSVNNAGRRISVAQGTQIIQFIEETMRGSSYVTDQLNTQNNEVTQKSTPTANNANGSSAWYKVTTQLTNLGFDNKRNDFAYKITYMITPYGINEMRSSYMPEPDFRGLQKTYNYWFTGKNNSVLRYEQSLNNEFFIVLSDQVEAKKSEGKETDSRILYKRSWSTRSAESDKGGYGNVNEPAANAADSLYNAADFAKITLGIVGDPAWIPQGEVAGTSSPRNFSFAPFYNDGTINIDAAQVLFDINFNQPVDYNFQTGIMDVSGTAASSNTSASVQSTGTGVSENATYTAVSVKSTFSKGRFEQELNGILFTGVAKNTDSATTDSNPRPAPDTNALPSPGGSTVNPNFNNNTANTTQGGTANPAQTNPDFSRQGSTAGGTTVPANNPNPVAPAQPVSPTDSKTAPQPAGYPNPATSNGEVNGGSVPPTPTAGRLQGANIVPNSSTVTQLIAKDA